MPLTGSQIRARFLEYFEKRGHRVVHSSSLIPPDETLLFTNAGMNQFKDVFLGADKRDYNRAATSQKCVRAGGKHNDLENVGFTNRHHTFFEMLGNFSFGDYFKKDAIAYAWELVTSPEWYGVDKSRLYATIFEGSQGVPRDTDAEKFWQEVGVPKDRIFAMGMKDNFWQMGDTGPCGPCSELHYDSGVEASDKKHPDCAAGKCQFPCPHDCGRYMEIWNLVFMQFDRDASGKLTPLPKPSIDTGMGLERIAAVLQGKVSNYDTDLFTPLIKKAAELTGVDAKKELEAESKKSSAASLRVIADHARCVTFLISDGVLPSNEGRGYVLRKILRRGIRHGRLLGQDKPFMHEMVYAVRDLMADAYPELKETAERVAKVVEDEERRFSNTVKMGLERLELDLSTRQQFEKSILNLAKEGAKIFFDELRMISGGKKTSTLREFDAGRAAQLTANYFLPIEILDYIAQIQGLFINRGRYQSALAAELRGRMLPSLLEVFRLKSRRDLNSLTEVPEVDYRYSGTAAFKLYDTFGLQFDFIADAVRDIGLQVDAEEFDAAMAEQRERARASWKGGAKQSAAPVYRELDKTKFEGYTQTESRDCEVLATVKDGQGVRELKAGESGEVVLDHTPFYADSGGQVGDIGILRDASGNIVAEVNGCVMPVAGVRAHKVVAKQPLHVGQKVDAVVHADVRRATVRNHTGTHLVHAALREVLGKHVKQAGSLVDPKHLRFDFSHFTGVADEELQDIEDLVNKEVLKNTRVDVINDVPIDVAINEYKAMALFGEKYGDKVRVIKIGDFSTELCGGIHTAATGEIGLVKLLHESSVSSGVRRVEAITGEDSVRHFRTDHRIVNLTGQMLGQPGEDAEAFRRALETKDDEIKRLRKELEQMRMKSAAASVSSATDQVKEVNGIKVLAQRVDNVDRNQMRTLVDNLRNKLGSGVVVLGSVSEVEGEKKVAIIVGVTKDLISKIQAGKIVGAVAKKVGGSGGGRPDMAEAGGKDPSQLDAALADAPNVVASLL